MTTNKSIAVCLAVLCVLSLAAAPAAASHDEDDFWGGLSEDSNESSLGVTVAREVAALTSWGARQTATVSDVLSGETDTTATEYADDFQETFNANNETLEEYASERVNATEQYDVYRLEFHDRDEAEAIRYLVSNGSGGSFSNARVVDQAEFDSLNRSVDYTIEADWYVSRNAADELETFVDEYAEPNEDVPRSYYAEMKAKYGDGLESGLWGSA